MNVLPFRILRRKTPASDLQYFFSAVLRRAFLLQTFTGGNVLSEATWVEGYPVRTNISTLGLLLRLILVW